jgi:hypothetical protein
MQTRIIEISLIMKFCNFFFVVGNSVEVSFGEGNCIVVSVPFLLINVEKGMLSAVLSMTYKPLSLRSVNTGLVRPTKGYIRVGLQYARTCWLSPGEIFLDAEFVGYGDYYFLGAKFLIVAKFWGK